MPQWWPPAGQAPRTSPPTPTSAQAQPVSSIQSTVPSPNAASSPNTTSLPDTGAPDWIVPVGVVGLVLLAAGSLFVAAARRRSPRDR